MMTAAEQLVLVAKGFCGSDVPLSFADQLPTELVADGTVVLPRNPAECEPAFALGYLAAQTAMYLDCDLPVLRQCRGLERALLQLVELPRTFTALQATRPGAVVWLAAALQASSARSDGLYRVLEGIAWLRFPQVAKHVADLNLVREFAVAVGVKKYLQVRGLVNEAVDAVDTFDALKVVQELMRLLNELAEEQDANEGASERDADLDEALKEFDDADSGGDGQGDDQQDQQGDSGDAGASEGDEAQGGDDPQPGASAGDQEESESDRGTAPGQGLEEAEAGGTGNGEQDSSNRQQPGPSCDASSESEPTDKQLGALADELEALRTAVPLAVRLRDQVAELTLDAPAKSQTARYRLVENRWQICKQSSLSGLNARTADLQDALREALRAKVRPPNGRDESGSSLRKGWVQAVCRGETKVFDRRRRDESLDTAVCVVLDQSGSMARDGHMVHATEGMAALILALAEVEDVDLYAGSFPARDPFALPSGRAAVSCAGVERLAEPGLHPLSAVARVLSVSPAGNTPMHCAIEFAHDELERSKRLHRVVIVITDGVADCPTEVAKRLAAEPDVKHILISIGTRASQSTARYFDHVAEVPDAAGLPKALLLVAADVIGS